MWSLSLRQANSQAVAWQDFFGCSWQCRNVLLSLQAPSLNPLLIFQLPLIVAPVVLVLQPLDMDTMATKHVATPPSTRSSSKPAISDTDTFTWDTAMAKPESHLSNWLKAAGLDVSALGDTCCWEKFPMTEATMKILPGT
jgi:hypothetical protein